MMPIRRGDGTGLSVPGFSEVRKGDGTVLWSEGPDIPDSVVSRDPDNLVRQTQEKLGLRFETSQQWPEMEGTISPYVSGATVAYIETTGGTVLGQTDISGLSAGDTFKIDGLSLSANTDYNIFLDDSGGDGSWTSGYDSGASFPYTSSDGNLVIKNGANTAGAIPVAHAIVTVGNIT